MNLKGDFDPSSLASILQLLSNEKKTGVLRVVSDDNEVRIFIQDGAIIYAMGSQKEGRLGHLLISKGLITPDQLQQCLAEARSQKLAMGKILVGRGIISSEQLKSVIRKQAEFIVFNLFFWDQGSFEYSDARLNLNGLVVTRLDIMSIILEATRRIDEMSILKKQISNDRIVFRISQKTPNQREITFNTLEWRFMTLVDGSRTVRELVAVSGYDEFVVYQVLNSLLASGVIEKDQRSAGQPEEAACREAAQERVIAAYNDILCGLQRHLVAAHGRWVFTAVEQFGAHLVRPDWRRIQDGYRSERSQWAAAVMESLKRGFQPLQKSLIRNFHPDQPAGVNIQAVKETLKRFQTFEAGHDFLTSSLNEFLLNTLGEMPQILGVAPTRALMADIRRRLQAPDLSDRPSAEVQRLQQDVTRILAAVDHKILADKKAKAFIGGIFGVSGRL
ncbi:MAG: DUF4388 domain-containing protein [Desulfobacterales bacterium]|jgi:hypothetical protein|nr:DUF4388 domain-containing protein [Desulfobacterales bacterium]